MPTINWNERFAKLTPMQQRIIRDRQSARRALRQPRQVPKRMGFGVSMSYYLCGGVHTVEGEFLKAMKIKSRSKVQQRKAPRNPNRWCAIEIEMITKGDNDAVVDALLDAGVAEYVHLKDDGSVHGTDARPHEHELVLCAELSRMPGIIDRVCDALRRPEVDAGVNKTCGLHIHLDMRNDNVEAAYRNLVHSYEPLLSKLVPQSRVENTFCKPPTTADFEDAQSEDDRYKAINPCAYASHTTLEIRIFSGSVNAMKIKQYLAIVSGIAYKNTYLGRNLSTADQWGEQVGWDSSLITWIKDRAQDFGHNL